MLSSNNVAFLGFSPLVDQGAASAADQLVSQRQWPEKASILHREGFAISRAGARFYSPLGLQPFSAADRSIAVMVPGGSTGCPFAPSV